MQLAWPSTAGNTHLCPHSCQTRIHTVRHQKSLKMEKLVWSFSSRKEGERRNHKQIPRSSRTHNHRRKIKQKSS